MLDFIVGPRGITSASGKHPVRASIPNEAAHAFFRPYFASARVEAKKDFLDFWGGTDVSGYELVRLRHVLVECLLDLSARPARFRVLRGWTGLARKQEAEIWEEVVRDDLKKIAQDIIEAIDEARRTTDYIWAIGD